MGTAQGDCSGDTPYWSDNAKRCVECFSDVHCGEKEVCDHWWECEPVECTEDEHCSGSTPYCHINNNVCVECYKDRHCDDPKECDDGKCVGPECTGDEHCPSFKPHCDNEECVECYDDDHCPGLETCEGRKCIEGDVECTEDKHCPSDRPRCWNQECVECVTDHQCDPPKKCEDGECVGPECTKSEHCAGRTPYCWNEECVECRDVDYDCPGLQECVNNECVKGDVECTEDEHCTYWGRPYCWSDECVECIRDRDCDEPNNCVDNKCVGPECTKDEHCPSSMPRCWNEECVKCVVDSDCPGNLRCEENHTCEGGAECETYTDCPASKPCCNAEDRCVECIFNWQCPDGENCRKGICTSGCEDNTECKRGWRCVDGWCVKMQCGSVANPECPNPALQWCDNGICRYYVGEKCESWRECADGYFCGETGCEKRPCNDYTDCVAGLCCYQGECIACEDTGCYAQAQCPPGWFCDKEINKCRPRDCGRHNDCDKGYRCDLEIGACVALPTEKISLEDEEVLYAHPCRVGHDTDCRRGQVCIGYPVHVLKRILSPGTANGYCGEPDEVLIRITGLDDEKTCDYCRSLIGNIWPQSQVTLPSYHEHCRCDYEFV